MPTHRRIGTLLLTIGVIFVISGTATSHWTCGHMLHGCSQSYRWEAITVFALLTFGSISLAVALLMDLASTCSDEAKNGSAAITIRYVLLYLGVVCATTGLALFTARFTQNWSYLLTAVGLMLVLHAAAMQITAVNSMCNGNRVVVRRRVR